MRDPEKVKQLLSLISEAFSGVHLEDGVSLHKTIYLDNYGDISEEVARAIENDERHDWQKLVHDPEFLNVHGIGGISFFDAKGLRFHLPAYLTVAITHPVEEVTDSLLFTLTAKSDYNVNRLEILDASMKACIAEVLGYLRTLPEFEFDWKKIDAVLPFYRNGEKTNQ
ncbi:MAG TPA: hypothetical protein PKE06_17815 [Flavilitoribacter sp.]|nr:hypothetical protein [Flavilitoribacter sp.]HMQ91074.1 hypothetical protein [Flavilitoribacter sp.]